MVRFQVPSLRDDFAGFAVLGELARMGTTAGAQGATFLVDLTQARFLDGPMLASLGATIAALSARGVELSVELPGRTRVGTFLRRNGFARHFDGTELEDRYGTVIPYVDHPIDADEVTASYIARKIVSRPEIAGLAPGLTQKIENVLWEARENAREHGGSQRVFLSGQRYPTADMLEIQIADIGIGFREKINASLGKRWSAAQCLEWALKPRSTTRRTGPPGGLGLKVLRRFLQRNGGELIIASDGAVFHEDRDGVAVHRLDNRLLATAVSFKVDVSSRAAQIDYFVEDDLEGVVF